MQIVIHRVNKIAALQQVDPRYGVELDIRADGDRLILNHEPFVGGEDFNEYLKHYRHALAVFNVKEAGIEQRVIELAKQHGITNYFLLDVEFPYLYRAARSGVRNIAVRYSEDESIETVLKYKQQVDWVWIDTNTQLPLDAEIKKQLAGFKTCLVCPERWGRPQDIATYIQQLRALQFPLDAVMTSVACAEQWNHYAA